MCPRKSDRDNLSPLAAARAKHIETPPAGEALLAELNGDLGDLKRQMDGLFAEMQGGRTFTITRKERGSSAEDQAAAEKEAIGEALAASMDKMIQEREGNVDKK